MEVVRQTRAAGIEATGSFLIGLPGETRDDVMRTIDFARKLDCDYASFLLLKAIGTSDDLSRHGRITEQWDFPKYDFRGPVFVPFGFKNVEELKELQKLAYRRFYFRLSFILRKVRSLVKYRQFRRMLHAGWILFRVAFLGER